MQPEQIIDVDEFKFKVIFQPECGFGEYHSPDEWHAILVDCPYELMYAQNFGKDIKTPEKACEFIKPYLVKVVERWRKKNAA